MTNEEKLAAYAKAYKFYLANPHLTYVEVGERVGLHKTTIGNLVRRFRAIEGTNEPFFKSRKGMERKKFGTYAAKEIPQIAKPTIKNADAILAVMGVRF